MNGTSNNNTSLSVSSSGSSIPPSSNNTTTIAPCSSSTSSSSSSSSLGSTHNNSAALNAGNGSSSVLNSNLASLNGSGPGSLGISQPPTPFDYQQQFYAPFQGSQFGGQQSLYSPQNQLDSLVYDKLRLLSNQSQAATGAPGSNFYAHNTNGNGFKLLSKQSSSPTHSEPTMPPSSTSPRSLWPQKLPCNNWYQNPNSGTTGGSASPSGGFNFQQNLGLTAITTAGGGSGISGSLPNGSSPSPGSAFNASGFNYQRMGFSSTDAVHQQLQDTPPPHDPVKKG